MISESHVYGIFSLGNSRKSNRLRTGNLITTPGVGTVGFFPLWYLGKCSQGAPRSFNTSWKVRLWLVSLGIRGSVVLTLSYLHFRSGRGNLMNSGRCSPDALRTPRLPFRESEVGVSLRWGGLVSSASCWSFQISWIHAWDAQLPGNRLRGNESSAQSAGAEEQRRQCAFS